MCFVHLRLSKENQRYNAQKMKFAIKDFFSKCDEIRRFHRIWSYLLKKSLMENFIFCAALVYHRLQQHQLWRTFITQRLLDLLYTVLLNWTIKSSTDKSENLKFNDNQQMSEVWKYIALLLFSVHIEPLIKGSTSHIQFSYSITQIDQSNNLYFKNTITSLTLN